MPPDADIMVDGNDIWAPHPEAASSGNLAKTSQPFVMEDAVGLTGKRLGGLNICKWLDWLY